MYAHELYSSSNGKHTKGTISISSGILSLKTWQALSY